MMVAGFMLEDDNPDLAVELARGATDTSEPSHLRFEDWTMPNPDSEELGDALMGGG